MQWLVRELILVLDVVGEFDEFFMRSVNRFVMGAVSGNGRGIKDFSLRGRHWCVVWAELVVSIVSACSACLH